MPSCLHAWVKNFWRNYLSFPSYLFVKAQTITLNGTVGWVQNGSAEVQLSIAAKHVFIFIFLFMKL